MTREQIVAYLKNHKAVVAVFVAAAIFLLFIIAGGKKGSADQYELAVARRGDLAVAVNATGQVSAIRDVDLRPRVIGYVNSVDSVEGGIIKQGDPIISLDSKEAQKAAGDAFLDLKNSELDLDRIRKPAEESVLAQSQNSLNQAVAGKQTALSEIKKAQDNAYSSVVGAYSDLPDSMVGLENIMYSTDISRQNIGGNWDWNIGFYARPTGGQYTDDIRQSKESIGMQIKQARSAFDSSFSSFKKVSRDDVANSLDQLIDDTYNTTKLVSAAVETSKNLVDRAVDLLRENQSTVPDIVAKHQSQLEDFTKRLNGHLQDLQDAKKNLTEAKNSLVSAEGAIVEKQAALSKIKSGADDIDIEAKRLAVERGRLGVQDAQNRLSYYTIRAPFAGRLAKVNVKKGDLVFDSSPVAKVISAGQLIDVALNEVDAVKLQPGQPVSISLDALPDLNLKGIVSLVDPSGTVTQGVVMYNAKIALIDNDNRVRPGMSATANIITSDNKSVTLIPSSAIKEESGKSYVEIFDKNSRQVVRRQVVVGLSNDEDTEIKSGLEPGEVVVIGTKGNSDNPNNQ